MWDQDGCHKSHYLVFKTFWNSLEEMWEATSFKLHRKSHLFDNVDIISTRRESDLQRFWQTLKYLFYYTYSGFEIAADWIRFGSVRYLGGGG
jgi:hypothetical protein